MFLHNFTIIDCLNDMILHYDLTIFLIDCIENYYFFLDYDTLINFFTFIFERPLNHLKVAHLIIFFFLTLILQSTYHIFRLIR